MNIHKMANIIEVHYARWNTIYHSDQLNSVEILYCLYDIYTYTINFYDHFLLSNECPHACTNDDFRSCK
jgi:hypothetical protein